MFAEFVYFALAVFLILCGSRDGHLRYDISFDTLLGAALMILQVILHIFIGGSTHPSGQARNKVRNNSITRGYYAATMPLRLAS